MKFLVVSLLSAKPPKNGLWYKTTLDCVLQRRISRSISSDNADDRKHLTNMTKDLCGNFLVKYLLIKAIFLKSFLEII